MPWLQWRRKSHIGHLQSVGHKEPHLNFRAKFIVPPAAGFIYCERLQNLEFRLHRRKTNAEDHISKKGKILFFRLKADTLKRIQYYLLEPVY